MFWVCSFGLMFTFVFSFLVGWYNTDFVFLGVFDVLLAVALIYQFGVCYFGV